MEERYLDNSEIESEVISRTKIDIDRYRKGRRVLRILGEDNRPMCGRKININQIGHEFNFGANIYGFDRLLTEEENNKYKKAFSEIFNFATLPFYWKGYEYIQNKPNYSYSDSILTWCREHNIRPKGHPLAWRNEASIPDWLPKDPVSRWKLLEKRVKEVLSYFNGKIDVWDVFNEAVHCSLIKDTLSPAYKPADLKDTIEEVAEVLDWVADTHISGTYIVNEFNVMHGSANERFIKLLEELIRRGSKFNAIGIQAHEPIGSRYNLDKVYNTLDRFSQFGKELHITEFTPTSGGQNILGSWKTGQWDEEEQADYAEKFYRVCFSHPSVHAITWWDLCDRDAWQSGGGLLRSDLSQKPAYERLKMLINGEWTTRLQLETDENGEVIVDGFYGNYNCSIQLPGNTEGIVKFKLEKEQSERIELRLE